MKRDSVLIVLTVILAVALVAGGMWMTKKSKVRDEAELKALKSELALLEDRLNSEISNTQDASVYYPNADSMRVTLSQLAENVRNDQRMLTNKPEEVIAKLAVYNGNKASYETALNAITSERDRGTGTAISDLKGQLGKAKADLEGAIKKNKALNVQLSKAIRSFRGAKKELDALKAQQSQANSLGTDLDELRTQLNVVMEERNQLKALVEEKDRTIARQDSLIATMQTKTVASVARRVYDFKASYLFKRLGRDYTVDLSSAADEHRAGRIDEISIAFKAGEFLFDDNEDKIAYLTLFKDNQPYKFVRLPIRVANDRGSQVLDVRKPRLESGSYTIRVFYKEEQVMPDYKFVIR